MVERIFVRQALAACVIESDQTGDHCSRWSGLGVGDGLLEGYVASPGMEGDVGQPMLLRAVRIADTEIGAFCSGQISREASNQEVVFGGYGTGDAAANRRIVFTYTQALLLPARRRVWSYNGIQFDLGPASTGTPNALVAKRASNLPLSPGRANKLPRGNPCSSFLSAPPPAI